MYAFQEIVPPLSFPSVSIQRILSVHAFYIGELQSQSSVFETSIPIIIYTIQSHAHLKLRIYNILYSTMGLIRIH